MNDGHNPADSVKVVNAWDDSQAIQVQALALTGYDLDASVHLLLKVADGVKARRLIGALVADDTITFGTRGKAERLHVAVNIGFTQRGLYRLGLSQRHRRVLELHAPAYSEGATPRAARRLGDSGKSAPERWDAAFAAARADVLLSVHGTNLNEAHSTADKLAGRDGAKLAFSGWDAADRIEAEHLVSAEKKFGRENVRSVHFGFVDNLTGPVIRAQASDRRGEPHAPGELLLGHANDEAFNRFGPSETVPADVAAFFRNGSFAVLRRIEQHEGELNTWLQEQSTRHAPATPEYLKAKLCGRWPNGALLRPGAATQPALATEDLAPFDFGADPRGEGCPFGAHIRRTNPRKDRIFPPRLRPLFRRGMPYGPLYNKEQPGASRGLIGLFFCASIDDQFEHLMSEWVEKRPMGPPNRGAAKDPLIGNHDEPDAEFHIPLANADPMVLGGPTGGPALEPFVTTRGTLYALFPSRAALDAIALLEGVPPPADAEPPARARSAGAHAAPSPSTAAKVEPDDDDTIGLRQAPADRFCDLVMEGGVTSGIIYAAAVADLSKQYRFCNIGGSSIGAFAAALAAAAEFRRRNGSMDGFRSLRDLPELLAEEDRGRTLLQRLFQPQPTTKRLFAVFLAALGHTGGLRRYLLGLLTAMRQYWRQEALLGLLLVLIVLSGPLTTSHWTELLAWVPAVLATLPLALLGGILIGIFDDLRRGLVGNGYGLCRGWTFDDDKEKTSRQQEAEDDADDRRALGAGHEESTTQREADRQPPKKPPASDLTGYLHASIQAIAGRDPQNDPPLTFKDLWDAPGSPAEELGFTAGPQARRSINLEVYATNLAHGRPYRFPLDEGDDMGWLYFRPEQLADYFPKAVMSHLMAWSFPYEPKSPSDPPAGAHSEGLRLLPREHLPIVVAARLALSFPLLVSAVPLWAVDYEPQAPASRELTPCWFSDGGLCSNFPIHLFDSFVPKWPTFGISLQSRGKFRENERVWLPEKHFEGRGDTWNRGLADDLAPLKRLANFLIGLWLAAWRWNDMTMMRMPGVRDRVVRVMLTDEEGGVNIRMTGKQIRELAKTYGRKAAEDFIEKFARPGSPGWPEHRWVRFNRLLVALREQLDGIGFATRLDRHTPSLRQQLEGAKTVAPLRGPTRLATKGAPAPSEAPLTTEQFRELESLLALLSDVEQVAQGAGDNVPYKAMPRPSLRVRHPT